MKRLGKRVLSYLLVFTLLMGLYTPVYGAQMNEGTDTQRVEGRAENQEQSEVSESDGEASEQEQDTGISSDENKSVSLEDTESENEAETEKKDELALNYILKQEDDTHQSVIVELGDAENTVLESAVLTYQDGEGELHTAQAEEVVENIAVFLLDLPGEQERQFVSVQASAAGQMYEVSLLQKEDMEQIDMSSEEAAQVVAESKNEEAAIDTQTAEQVKNGVIAADESGISSDDIKDAITENNQLAKGNENGISTFSLGDDADSPASVAVEPKEKEHYIVVLDPGHGTIDKDGYDPGADHTFNDGTKFVEADITMKIANYVKQELARYPEVTVYMTHDTVGAANAIKMLLNERVTYAANKHADLLVSLHLNSFTTEAAHGAEVLVPKTGRYNTEVAENAQRAANNILKRLTSLGLYDRGLKEKDSSDYKYPDGSIADYYAIVREGMKAGIPSIIVEHAFLSGKDDKQYLNNEASIKNLAKADAYGIAQYFGIETGGETYEPVPEPKGEWRKSGGSWYYYIGSVKQTGWQKIDNIWYYFNGSGVMQTGWQKIGGFWYYLNSSGYMQTGWQKINGSWYYLNSSGCMQTGFQKIDGKLYYFQGSGVMLGGGWHNLGGCWYYMSGSGVALTGWQHVGGKWYYMDDSSRMKTGWYKVKDKWYYSNGSGVMQTGWLKLGNTWYYLNGNGSMAEGWAKVGSSWYYLNPGNGAMKTGWQKINSKWYFLNSNGAMQTGGWFHQGNTWYYLNGNGSMAEGWIRLGSTWYYLNPANGHMCTGWYKANNKWYYSNGSGAMQTGWLKLGSTWYYLTGSGAMAEGWNYINGKWYYLTPGNGAMKSGWFKVNGTWYYSNGSGAMQTGWLKLGNTWYFLNNSGAMAEGWTNVKGKNYYLTPGSGAMRTGWFQVNKTWYYCNGSGAMQTGWLHLGSTWYYCNGSGAMLTGWQTIGGKDYYFNNSGAWVEGEKRVEDNSSTPNNTKDLYVIEGDSSVTVEQMIKYYNASGCTYPSTALAKGGAADINSFSKIILEEANAEGIKAEVVFTQAMKETGWLKFGGDVKIEQFNFAGLGATGGGEKGNSFKDIRTGIRAQVQHLKAYASDKALNNTCVDERFKYVERKSALYVEWLGIPDNPTGAGWAASKNYGKDLVDMIKKLKSM